MSWGDAGGEQRREENRVFHQHLLSSLGMWSEESEEGLQQKAYHVAEDEAEALDMEVCS